jgi:hypothetical protein
MYLLQLVLGKILRFQFQFNYWYSILSNEVFYRYSISSNEISLWPMHIYYIPMAYAYILYRHRTFCVEINIKALIWPIITYSHVTTSEFYSLFISDFSRISSHFDYFPSHCDASSEIQYIVEFKFMKAKITTTTIKWSQLNLLSCYIHFFSIPLYHIILYIVLNFSKIIAFILTLLYKTLIIYIF